MNETLVHYAQAQPGRNWGCGTEGGSDRQISKHARSQIEQIGHISPSRSGISGISGISAPADRAYRQSRSAYQQISIPADQIADRANSTAPANQRDDYQTASEAR